MNNEIERFLREGKTRINILIVFNYIFFFLFLYVGAAGILILVLRSAGLIIAGFTLWNISIVLGILTGFIAAITRFVDIDFTARWLDRRLETNEAFSSWLSCGKRNYSGLPDIAIRERALSILEGQYRIDWPFGPLFKRLGIAAGSLVLTGFLIGVWFPGMKRNYSEHTVRVDIKQGNTSKNYKKGVAFNPQTQKDIARILFPRDKNMASLVMKSLQNGDMELLEKLLGQAKRDLEKNFSKASSPEERVILEQKKQQQNLLSKMIYSKFDQNNSGEGKPGKTENQGEGVDEKKGDKESDEKGNQKSGSVNKTDQKDDSENPGESKPDQPGGGNRNKAANPSEGLNAGTDTGNNKPGWKDEPDKTKRGKLILGKREGSPEMEYINPGNGVNTPLAKMLPGIVKSAETAMNRDDIPGEYEEFVGSYFKELTKEMAGVPKEDKK